jgi:hypothetical protein
MKYLHEHIDRLLADGKYHFTKDSAMTSLGLNQSQFRFQAYRLSKKGIIEYQAIQMQFCQEVLHLHIAP